MVKGKSRNNSLFILSLLWIVFIVFFRLDGVALIQDEGETACVARTISTQELIPRMWNGRNLIVQGAHDINKYFMPGMQSWGQYYITKFSYLILGKETTFSARFGFALIGIATLLVLYLFAKKNYRTPTISVIFLFSLSLSYYLIGFFRIARYYSLVLFISSLLFFFLANIINGKKKLNLKKSLLLGILGLALYYSHYLNFLLCWTGLGIYFLLFSRKNLFRFILVCSFLALFIIPDYFLFHISFLSSNKNENYFLFFFTKTFLNLLRVMPFLLLLPFWKLFFSKKQLQDFPEVQKWTQLFLVMIIPICLFVVAPNPNGYIVTRYILFIIPLSFILLFYVIDALCETKRFLPALFLVVFTISLQGADFFSNISEGVVLRQFLLQNTYEGETVQYLKEFIQPNDIIQSVTAAHNQIYQFYFPNNLVVGQVESPTPYQKQLIKKLPQYVFAYKTNPSYVIFRNSPEIIDSDIDNFMQIHPGKFQKIHQRTFKINTPFWKNPANSYKHVVIYKRIS